MNMTTIKSSIRFLYFVLVITFVCSIFYPVMASGIYNTGKPVLSASIIGANEFNPGTDIIINTVIENTGRKENQIYDLHAASDPIDPSDAENIKITLLAGDAPFTIKTDPRMIGNIRSGEKKEVTFHARVDQKAPQGTYYIRYLLSYTQPYATSQDQKDTLMYQYKSINQELSVPISIAPEVQPHILNVSSEHISIDHEGYLHLSIQNAGYENGINTIAKLVPELDSPLHPIESSVFIGDFPHDAIYICTFKIYVDDSAEVNTYPLDLILEYINNEGDNQETIPISFGVNVDKGVEFQFLDPNLSLYPGEDRTFFVNITNNGSQIAHSAKARISATSPFTVIMDTSLMGDIRPGETKTVRFEVQVDQTAVIKPYGLDIEVRYRDDLNNYRVSDPEKISIIVIERTGFDAFINNPIAMSIFVGLLIIIVYILYPKKHRQSESE